MTRTEPVSQRWENFRPSKTLWFWSLVGVVVATMVVGFSLGASVLFLRYRDLNQVWDLATQGGFFVAPIVYPLTILPETMHRYLYLWPPTPIIEFSRDVLVRGVTPSATSSPRPRTSDSKGSPAERTPPSTTRWSRTRPPVPRSAPPCAGAVHRPSASSRPPPPLPRSFSSRQLYRNQPPTTMRYPGGLLQKTAAAMTKDRMECIFRRRSSQLRHEGRRPELSVAIG